MSDVMERGIIKADEVIGVEKFTPYDPAEDLVSDEGIAYFMAEAFETNDVGYIAHALGVVARAKGMMQLAKETGLSREQLYRTLSDKGSPTLRSTLAIMKALGLRLDAKVVEKEENEGLSEAG